MDFLVEIEVVCRSEEDRVQVERMLPAERERGRELVRAGTIVRIWRIPGRFANLGIWRSVDATALHASLRSLPLFLWLDVKV